MKIAIKGIGIATPLGGTAELAAALAQPERVAPTIFKTDTASLSEYLPARKLRRIDHFTRMTLLAAYRALDDAQTLEELPTKLGIIVCSGYGPSLTTFDFLDSIIDDGAHLASPLSFSHSVHNIPAGVLSMLLGVSCPQTTICQLRAPVQTGLQTAVLWLAEKRVDRILFGAVDETTPILEETTARLCAEKNKPQPLPIGEGAAFFLLDNTSQGHAIAEINTSKTPNAIKLDSLWGQVPVAAAFNMAAAALSVKGTDSSAHCCDGKSVIHLSGKTDG